MDALQKCKGTNCTVVGHARTGEHSAECQAIHAAACAGGYFVHDDALERVESEFAAAVECTIFETVIHPAFARLRKGN